MKLLKKIKAIEVKRTFVLSDFMSSKKDKRKRSNFIPEKVFQKKLRGSLKKTLALKESRLDKIIKDGWKKRLVAYNNTDWYLGEVNTNEVGVWKRAGGLPLSWTNSSLAETAMKVKYALDHDPKLLKKRSRYTIPNMIKTGVNIIKKEKYLLPIIFKNGSGTNGRRGLKKRMMGDIDDGCMRSIAFAVSGDMKFKAYIGMPRKK